MTMSKHMICGLLLGLGLWLGGLPAVAQTASTQAGNGPGAESDAVGAPGSGGAASGTSAQDSEGQSTGARAAAGAPGAGTASGTPAAGSAAGDERALGSITGTVVDQTGAVVPGARVLLSGEALGAEREVQTGDDGRFSFANVTPGSFQVAVVAAGFATQTAAGILQAGESRVVPQIALVIAEATDELRVMPTRTEVAADQLKAEEKQRVLGVIPNFYVSYVPDAVALTSKQKFQIAWRTTIDPVSFGLTAVIAGVQQAQNDFSGYGQGAEGYAKRYGASYANFVAGTFIGSAIFPSLLKQDPRYFYKGTGSARSRVLYAIANAVICKSDDGHWQANYSAILGDLAAGGISNLYYPAKDRNGVGLTFENTLVGLGATAAANVLQEFFIKKITPGVPNRQSSKPQPQPQHSSDEMSNLPVRGSY
jgi:hypothetical protein